MSGASSVKAAANRFVYGATKAFVHQFGLNLRSDLLGTRVRVTHRDRSVVVTINDRGPFVRGRVLDLTTGAARALGFRGLGKVTAEVL